MTPLSRATWPLLGRAALVTCSWLAVAAAQAQTIELYDQPEFRGTRLTLESAAADLGAFGLGDRVASVVVRRGQWEFCTEPQFRGACITVGPGRYAQLPPALRGSLSSLREGRVEPPPPQQQRPQRPREREAAASIVLLGRDHNRQRLELDSTVADLRSRSFNDTAVWVDVRAGTWELCNGIGFTDACLRLEPGRHTLPTAFSGQVSSLRPLTGAAPVVAPTARPALVLFEDSDWRGRRLAVLGPIPRLDASNFNDTATSLEIFRGRWQLCQHADYHGQCLVLGPGRHQLSGQFQDSVSSLRPVFGRDDQPLPARGGVTLYERSDFSGRSLLRTEVAFDMASVGFNDRASAIEVHGGQWELCSDARFGGRCAVFGPGLHQLPDFLNDRVSSLRPR